MQLVFSALQLVGVGANGLFLGLPMESLLPRIRSFTGVLFLCLASGLHRDLPESGVLGGP